MAFGELRYVGLTIPKHEPKDPYKVKTHLFGLFDYEGAVLASLPMDVSSAPGSTDRQIAEAHRLMAGVLRGWAADLEKAAKDYDLD